MSFPLGGAQTIFGIERTLPRCMTIPQDTAPETADIGSLRHELAIRDIDNVYAISKDLIAIRLFEFFHT